ncbi:MAG: 16S rRNA (cytosine(1402)-N(4))-methyltransferase RsmH [Candidatus Omnitrophica bacterium]|nr:16S rRNA (cytosine(1402)-N(4))-methyltransferase RsmH [Candidatus Omnitrophota bacterium]
MAEDAAHAPVMLSEVLEYLAPRPGTVFVDATVGLGGHARAILERLGAKGTLIGIDRDADSLARARQTLQNPNAALVHGNFAELGSLLSGLGIEQIDGILFDLGISSFQLDDPERSFSFHADGPLDMRLDRTSFISAYDLVNSLSEDQLSQLLRSFGQERWHRRIAHRLIQERQRRPIATTSQLSAIVMSSLPQRFRRFHYRIHPATRTFQAVRIAVNRELETLEAGIAQAIKRLRPGGRIAVLSFHSLEDRIVKFAFKSSAAPGELTILTPKPLTPRESEIRDNPRSRSAKLRAAQKT